MDFMRPLANALHSARSTTLSAIAPMLLAAVMLLAPLAAGYSWVSGGHAGESHVHRHHLLEKLVPNSLHHAPMPPATEESAASDGDNAGGSVILHGFSVIALPAVLAPAFLPELVTYFDGTTAALLAAAVSGLLLTLYTMPFFINLPRPQRDTAPPVRPPTA